MEKSMKIIDESMKNMENSIKTVEKNPETSGKIDERQWEVPGRTQKKNEKKSQLNSAPNTSSWGFQLRFNLVTTTE